MKPEHMNTWAQFPGVSFKFIGLLLAFSFLFIHCEEKLITKEIKPICGFVSLKAGYISLLDAEGDSVIFPVLSSTKIKAAPRNFTDGFGSGLTYAWDIFYKGGKPNFTVTAPEVEIIAGKPGTYHVYIRATDACNDTASAVVTYRIRASDPTGTIRGVVTVNGVGVNGMGVYLLGEGPLPDNQASTNERGLYFFNGLPAGAYNVSIGIVQFPPGTDFPETSKVVNLADGEIRGGVNFIGTY
jgi:hypothetical protein